jgi:hypothetical protein
MPALVSMLVRYSFRPAVAVLVADVALGVGLTFWRPRVANPEADPQR